MPLVTSGLLAQSALLRASVRVNAKTHISKLVRRGSDTGSASDTFSVFPAFDPARGKLVEVRIRTNVASSGQSLVRMSSPRSFPTGISSAVTTKHSLRVGTQAWSATTRQNRSGLIPTGRTAAVLTLPTTSRRWTTIVRNSAVSAFVGTQPKRLTWRRDFMYEFGITVSGTCQYTLNAQAVLDIDYVFETPRFVNLGGASGASSALVVGSGPATAQSRSGLHVLGASGGGLGVFLVSANSQPIKVFGGTLHANPAALVLPARLDVNGQLDVFFAWPSSAKGTSFFAQWAGLASSTFELSNGLRAITQ